MLAEWKLWDHMDAILSLGVTSLVDRLLGVPQPSGPAANQVSADRLRTLDRQQKRDLLLLVACYDNSTRENVARRAGAGCAASWATTPGRRWWDRALGVAVTLAVVATIIYWQQWDWLATPWPYAIVAAGWVPWLARFVKWHLRRPPDRPQRPRAQAARRLACAGC